MAAQKARGSILANSDVRAIIASVVLSPIFALITLLVAQAANIALRVRSVVWAFFLVILVLVIVFVGKIILSRSG